MFKLIYPIILSVITTQAANLIVNGDAEGGAGSLDGFTPVAIPGWSLVGNFNSVQYDISGGFPTSSDFGPDTRGLNFFSGGRSNYSSASQVIDFSAYAASINLGVMGYVLSGYFGGWAGQNDNAVLTMSFRDTLGAALATEVIGGVTAADRGSGTGLLFRDVSGTIPIGTRDAYLLLEMRRDDGVYNDGYADNLSLEISTIPEPSTYAAAVAMAFLAWSRFFRKPLWLGA